MTTLTLPTSAAEAVIASMTGWYRAAGTVPAASAAPFEATGAEAARPLDQHIRDYLDESREIREIERKYEVAECIRRNRKHVEPEEQALRESIRGVLRTKFSLADYDEDMQFVAYEMAYSECHMACTNGTRCSSALEKAVRQLNEALESYDGNEVSDQELQRRQQRVDGYQKRLHYWRQYYVVATQELARVVDHADEPLQRYMTRTFTAKPETAEVRRIKNRETYAAETARKTLEAHQAQRGLVARTAAAAGRARFDARYPN